MYGTKYCYMNTNLDSALNIHVKQPCLQMIDTWLKAIDDNRLVDTIFLDLQKAFDVVDHSILVKN